jgi:hypothetical protein
MGRFFEKFQIVEVLQVFNVLQGKMSLIGYRPLPLCRVLQLQEELGGERIEMRHSVRPGITGITQIVGKASLSNSERIRLENKYNMLVQTEPDLKVIFYNTLIILETISQIFLKRNFFISYILREINAFDESYMKVNKEYVDANEEYVDPFFKKTLKAALKQE